MTKNTGIIRITNKTPDGKAIAALLRAFFAFSFARRKSEFTEVVFRNRSITPIPDTEIVITRRTPSPTEQIFKALLEVWARTNANQQIRVRFEIGQINEVAKAAVASRSTADDKPALAMVEAISR